VMPNPVEVHIFATSPLKNRVYSTTEIPLKFYVTIEYSNFWPDDPEACFKVLSFRYWQDGGLRGEEVGEDLPKSHSMALAGLSDGEHNVKVWVKVIAFDKFLSGYSDTVTFRVDAFPPEIRFLTTQEVFETSDVPLNFTVSKAVSWMGYSLDGNTVVEVTYDLASTKWLGGDNYRLVLQDLPAGVHSLILYADDVSGNRGASEPFSFNVTQQTPSEANQIEAFPTSQLVASSIIAIAAAFSFGMVGYLLKRKRRSGES
jgi:hypothetical protein